MLCRVKFDIVEIPVQLVFRISNNDEKIFKRKMRSGLFLFMRRKINEGSLQSRYNCTSSTLYMYPVLVVQTVCDKYSELKNEGNFTLHDFKFFCSYYVRVRFT